MQPNKVYIGGLPEHTRQEDLQSCFGKIGNIINIELKYVFVCHFPCINLRASRVGYGFVVCVWIFALRTSGNGIPIRNLTVEKRLKKA